MTNRYLKKAELYKRFAKDWRGKELDFSSQALQEMYDYETFGKGDLSLGVFTLENKPINGYAYGKNQLDITVGMWKEDEHKPWFFIHELYEEYPHWWLNKVFNRKNPPVGWGEEVKKVVDKCLCLC